MMDVDVVGLDAAMARMQGLPDRVKQRLRVVMTTQIIELRDGVKAKIASVFSNQTGRLAASIGGQTSEDTQGYEGRVFSSGVPYARIQEFGGTINHPGSDKLQAFMGRGGKMVFTRHTAPHPIPIPERSYMRTTLAERRLAIVGAIQAAVVDAL